MKQSQMEDVANELKKFTTKICDRIDECENNCTTELDLLRKENIILQKEYLELQAKFDNIELELHSLQNIKSQLLGYIKLQNSQMIRFFSDFIHHQLNSKEREIIGTDDVVKFKKNSEKDKAELETLIATLEFMKNTIVDIDENHKGKSAINTRERDHVEENSQKSDEEQTPTKNNKSTSKSENTKVNAGGLNELTNETPENTFDSSDCFGNEQHPKLGNIKFEKQKTEEEEGEGGEEEEEEEEGEGEGEEKLDDDESCLNQEIENRKNSTTNTSVEDAGLNNHVDDESDKERAEDDKSEREVRDHGRFTRSQHVPRTRRNTNLINNNNNMENFKAPIHDIFLDQEILPEELSTNDPGAQIYNRRIRSSHISDSYIYKTFGILINKKDVTVRSIWEEYHKKQEKGYSMYDLESKYQAAWRGSGQFSRIFKRRACVIKAIQAGIKKRGMSAEDCINLLETNLNSLNRPVSYYYSPLNIPKELRY